MNFKLCELVTKASIFGFIFLLSSCSDLGSGHPRPVELYRASYRQLPPPPVYSRVTWSQLPQPTPLIAKGNSPLLRQVIHFELPNSTLAEAVEALSQTIGYEAEYPQDLAARAVSLNVEGSPDEILAMVSQQAKVDAQLDRVARVVRVMATQSEVQPVLP